MRQAFSRAIDRDTYVATRAERRRRAGAGLAAAGHARRSTADVGNDLAFDDERRAQLLADAGYPDGEDFPKVTLMIADDEHEPARRGVLPGAAQAEPGHQHRHRGARRRRPSAIAISTGDFQLTWSSWFADYADPENWLAAAVRDGRRVQRLGYSNPQVDELLRQAAAELDQAKRLALYERRAQADHRGPGA